MAKKTVFYVSRLIPVLVCGGCGRSVDSYRHCGKFAEFLGGFGIEYWDREDVTVEDPVLKHRGFVADVREF